MGKTTVLEAVHFLSTGKSFRNTPIKGLIKNGCDALTLYAEIEDRSSAVQFKLGTQRSRQGEKLIKLNGESVPQQAQIARRFPVIAIDPDAYLFVDKPPAARRAFMDWLLFHVKHDYLKLWKNTHQANKQLNHLYRHQRDTPALRQWEQTYLQFAEPLHRLREETFNWLREEVISEATRFLPGLAIDCVYYPGWGHEKTLSESLQNNRSRHMKYGHLLTGVHKMDVRLLVEKQPASHVLSRGQKKTLSMLFHLAHLKLIQSHTQINPMVCVDDLDAELDEGKVRMLAERLNNEASQVFISTLQPKLVQAHFNDVEVFHVKHV